MSIPRLSLAGVEQLAVGSDMDAGQLYGQTGGNPFFVTEVLASGSTGVPATVRDAVFARADRLSYAARSVLDVAAVIGFSSEDWLLANVAGPDADAADECVARGVLRYLPNGNGYVFRHEIAREAILSALPPPRRNALHRKVLAAIEASSPGPDMLARMAHHAEEAGDRDAVLRYAPAAAERAAALYSHGEAAAQYARALRFADALPATERAELLESYADECSVVDHLDEAIKALQEAAGIWRAANQPLREGRVLSEISPLFVHAGRNQEGEQASRAGLDLLQQLPPGKDLARAYAIQSALRMLNRDNAEAIYWGEKAIELGERFGYARSVVNAYNNIGSAMVISGDNDGITFLERSLELALSLNMDATAALVWGNLGSATGEMYQFTLASRYLEEGIAFCAERDLDNGRFYMTSWLALCHLYQGNWNKAAECGVLVTGRRNVATISQIMGLLALGRLRARRGDPDVWSALDEAVEMAAQTATLQRIGPVRAARAEAAWLAGDIERAGEEARAVYDLALKHRHIWHVGELSYWRWKSGEDIDLPEYAAEPYRLQIQGHWQAAADAWSALGCPYEAARALAESDNEAALKRALQEFDRLGAAPMSAVVSRKLRDLGARGIPRGPRPETLANPAGLTRRELDVLLLVAEGLRDADIAERLYLSPKTVGHHVSSILGKLGVQRRTEAAAEAARLGITSTK